MATLLGSLLVSLGLDSGQFKSGSTAAQKEVKKLQKSIETTGANLQKAGAVLSVGITAPFTALVAAAVPAATESRQALAQVNAALASMGPVAGRTTEQLQAAAGRLQDLSNFDDDDILKSVTANLLTFGKVTGETFDRAQLAAVNLSARLGQDLQSSAIQLGKALNDPVKGVTALQRVGVSFTAAQKDQIKAMAGVGDVAGAQAIVLAELEKQFSGAAAAQRAATPDAAMQQQWRTFQETIGELALKVLPAVQNAIGGLLAAFNELSPQMQTFAVGAVAVGAALGPVLGAVGTMVSLVAPLAAKLATVGAGGAAAAGGLAPLAPILIPLAAAVAGVVVAWKNWDQIKPWIDGVAERAQVQTAAIDGYLKQLTDGVNAFDRRMGIPSKDAFLSSIAASVVETWNTVNQYDLAKWAAGVDAQIAAAFRSAVVSAERLYQGVRTWLVDRLGGVFTWVNDKTKAVGDAFFQLYDRVVGHSYVPDMVDGIAAQMARLDAVMVSPATGAAAKVSAAFKSLADDMRPLLDELFPEARALRVLDEQIALIERARKAGPAAGGLSNDQADEARRRLLLGVPTNDNAPVPPVSDEPLVKVKLAMDELVKTLPDLSRRTTETTAKMVEAFAGLARDAVASLRGMVSAFKGGDILGGIAGLLDLVVQVGGVIGGNRSGRPAISVTGATPGFGGSIIPRALGGPVVPNQTYLVGEKGPELLRFGRAGSIVPNDQIGGLGGTKVFDMRGAVMTEELVAQMRAAASNDTDVKLVGMAKRSARSGRRRLA